MKTKLWAWFVMLLLCLLYIKLQAHGATRIEKLAASVEPKVVKIGIVTKKGGGTCSGAFVTPSGDVLTCAHCFEHGEGKYFVKTSDDTVYSAALIRIDHNNDLALLSVNAAGHFSYFKLGSEPVKGQQVLSFGSPLGIQSVMTVGWVVKLVKEAKLFIFHSAFISPGNSGGPLVDLKGRLIGVNEAILKYGMFGLQTVHGVYVAIDVVTVKEFLKRGLTQ